MRMQEGKTTKEVPSFKCSFTLPRSSSTNLLWNSTGIFTRNKEPRPGWSGFMQDVSTGKHLPKSDVVLLPLLDLNPFDESCIYTTLLFIQDQAKQLCVEIPCVTFD